MGEAVALPLTEEAEGEVRRIALAPRLTPHVRHLAKYVDLPVPAGRAFVFWLDGTPDGHRARSLREFVSVVESASAQALDGHLRRGDFSRWIADVFGDYPLAKEIRALEESYRSERIQTVGANIAQTVRARYELIDPLRERRQVNLTAEDGNNTVTGLDGEHRDRSAAALDGQGNPFAC